MGTVCFIMVITMGCKDSLASHASGWGPTHGRQPSLNFSYMGPFHGLQLFTNCSSVGPPEVTSLASKPALSEASHTSHPPSGIHLLWHGVLHGLQMDLCSIVVSSHVTVTSTRVQTQASACPVQQPRIQQQYPGHLPAQEHHHGC